MRGGGAPCAQTLCHGQHECHPDARRAEVDGPAGLCQEHRGLDVPGNKTTIK